MWPLEEPLEGPKKWLLVLKSQSVIVRLMAQQARGLLNHLIEKSLLDQFHNSIITHPSRASRAAVRCSALTYAGRACAAQPGSPLMWLQTADTQMDNNLKRMLFCFSTYRARGHFILAL